MPEIYTQVENAARGWDNRVQVRHVDGVQGFWTQPWRLLQGVYDNTEYTHQWQFYAYKKNK